MAGAPPPTRATRVAYRDAVVTVPPPRDVDTDTITRQRGSARCSDASSSFGQRLL